MMLEQFERGDISWAVAKLGLRTYPPRDTLGAVSQRFFSPLLSGAINEKLEKIPAISLPFEHQKSEALTSQ